jgi:hypothetical protein
MNRVTVLGLVVALPILLAATPMPADGVFEGCEKIPNVSVSTGIPDYVQSILGGEDRIAGPTSSTGIPLEAWRVFEGCDRIGGSTTSTGIPILSVLTGSSIIFR